MRKTQNNFKKPKAMKINRLAIYSILMLMPLGAVAQKERGDIRSGNKKFEKGDFSAAEVDYKRAISKEQASLPAYFNLGGAVYKQSRYDEAEKLYKSLAEMPLDSATRAQTLYNQGNAQISARQSAPEKLDQAIESYKQSLRLNPTDMDAKFNLAYAQKLKQEQNKEQNKDQKQDKKDQQQDQKEDQKDQKQDQDQQKQDQQQQQQQPQNQQDNERTLKAIQAAEDKTKRQMEERKDKEQVVMGRGAKNW